MDVYVMKEGRRTGPYQPFHLREMLEEGTLLPGDQVWHEGMEEWQPLEKTDSLRWVVHHEPPPAPSTPEPPVVDRPDTPRSPASLRNPEEVLALLRARRNLASRRFFARHIDMFLIGLATVAVATAMGRADWWSLNFPENFYILLAPALVWMLVEPFILLLWGTTPGKAALGLRVEPLAGGRLTLRQTFLRSLLVWVGGMGVGLRTDHILPVAQWAYAWWVLQNRGTTPWDHTAKTVVRAVPLGRNHAIGLALVATLYTGFWFWLTLTAPLPARLDEKFRDQTEQLRTRM